MQNGKSSLKSPQTLATQDFAPASFLSTHSIGNTQDREVLGVFLCLGGVMRPIAEAADCRGIERGRAGIRRREKPRLQALERRVTIGKMK